MKNYGKNLDYRLFYLIVYILTMFLVGASTLIWVEPVTEALLLCAACAWAIAVSLFIAVTFSGTVPRNLSVTLIGTFTLFASLAGALTPIGVLTVTVFRPNNYGR
jgi:hypothetical protein